LFTNQESQAETIFNDIQTDYNTYRDSINNADIAYKRNITFMSYDPSSTKFSMPQDQYFQNLTADAGGNLTTPTTAQPGDPSVMKGQLQNSSLVIDLTPEYAFNASYANWQHWLGYSADKIKEGESSALDAFKTSKQYINSMDAPPFERNSELWRLDLVSNQGASGKA
jgi:ABC-type Fe3+-hydroxamate transport system substrate-binding protein